MGGTIGRAWRLHNGPDRRTVLRYTALSAVATGSGFALLGIIFGVLRLWSEVPSAIFANLVMIAPLYYLNRTWVWGRSGRSHWRREVVPFWVVSISGLLVSVAAAALARHISATNHLRHAEATALLLAVTVAALGSLWLVRLFVFQRLFGPGSAVDSPRGPGDRG